jgi:ParB family chromosome partitioning protein
MKLPLASIIVGKRLRPIDPARVAILAESMDAKGLDQPIVVRPLGAGRHALTIGAHRLAAAEQLGWPEIDGVVTAHSEPEAELAEIDENLIRAELSALDRAVFLTARKRVWEALHPRARHGGDRRSTARKISSGEASPLGFSVSAAEAVGLSPRTIREAITLAAALGPELIDRLRSRPIADNAVELKALAKLDDRDRARAADQLATGKAQNLAGALKAIGRGKPDLAADEQIFRSLVALWSRAGAKAKKRFLAHAGLQPVEGGR